MSRKIILISLPVTFPKIVGRLLLEEKDEKSFLLTYPAGMVECSHKIAMTEEAFLREISHAELENTPVVILIPPDKFHREWFTSLNEVKVPSIKVSVCDLFSDPVTVAREICKFAKARSSATKLRARLEKGNFDYSRFPCEE